MMKFLLKWNLYDENFSLYLFVGTKTRSEKNDKFFTKTTMFTLKHFKKTISWSFSKFKFRLKTFFLP